MENTWIFEKSPSKHPCVKDCPGRNADCHGTCDIYNAWKAERTSFRDGLRNKRYDESMLDGYMSDRNRGYGK